MKKSVFFLVCFLFTHYGSFSQNNLNTTLLDQWFFGPTFSMASSDSHIFLGSGHMLLILDKQSIPDIVILAELNINQFTYDFKIRDQYLYAAGSAGLSIFDISNPLFPEIKGSVISPDNALEMVFYDDYCYLACGSIGLQIIDISNPESPAQVEFFTAKHGFHNIDLDKQYLFVGAGFSGFQIYDISQPLIPASLGSITYSSSVRGIKVNQNIAYVAAGTSGIRIIDITDPGEPTEIASIEGFDVFAVDVDGDRLGASTISSIYLFIDISDPAFPTVVSSLQTEGIGRGIRFQDEFAFFINWQYFRTYNIADMSNPVEMAVYYMPVTTREIKIVENIAYLANDAGGLWILDVSDPENISALGSLDTPGEAFGLEVIGNTVYLADKESLIIIDVSDPTGPYVISSLAVGDLIWDVTVQNNIAYLANNAAGLCVVDVSDPYAPYVIEKISKPDSYCKNIVVIENIAYLKASSYLWMVDISNPSAPFELGNYYFFYFENFDVEDNIAFIARGPYGVTILDVSDPSNPSLIHSLENLGLHLIDVKAGGDYLYLVDRHFKLRILDISNPDAPIEVGYGDAPYSRHLAVKDNHVYVSQLSGFRIISNDLLTGLRKPALTQTCQNFNVFPNPATHSINFSFEMPDDGFISIDIYDAQGKLLFNKSQIAANRGSFLQQLAVQSYNPGFYFYRIEIIFDKSIQSNIVQGKFAKIK
jgi:hypothetical protein